MFLYVFAIFAWICLNRYLKWLFILLLTLRLLYCINLSAGQWLKKKNRSANVWLMIKTNRSFLQVLEYFWLLASNRMQLFSWKPRIGNLHWIGYLKKKKNWHSSKQSKCEHFRIFCSFREYQSIHCEEPIVYERMFCANFAATCFHTIRR